MKSETNHLIDRIFFDFTQRGHLNKGFLFPINNGHDITGKANRQKAKFDGVYIFAPELLWLTDKQKIVIRVKPNKAYLRGETLIDKRFDQSKIKIRLITCMHDWMKLYDKVLKDERKKIRSSYTARDSDMV